MIKAKFELKIYIFLISIDISETWDDRGRTKSRTELDERASEQKLFIINTTNPRLRLDTANVNQPKSNSIRLYPSFRSRPRIRKITFLLGTAGVAFR